MKIQSTKTVTTMTKIKLTCTLLTALAVAPTLSNAWAGKSALSYVEGNELQWIGSMMHPSDFDELVAVYENANPKPTILHINSDGGDVGIGRAIGRFVFDNKLDVKVTATCFSSCANYVFPAGKTKYIGKYATVGWHGDPYSSDYMIEYNNTPKGMAERKAQIAKGVKQEFESQGVPYDEQDINRAVDSIFAMEQPSHPPFDVKNPTQADLDAMRQSLIELYQQNSVPFTEEKLNEDMERLLETSDPKHDEAFYQYIGMNPMIPRYAHITQHGRKVLGEMGTMGTAGWTYTPQVMAQLGLKNIVLMEGDWIFLAKNFHKNRPISGNGSNLVLIEELKLD